MTHKYKNNFTFLNLMKTGNKLWIDLKKILRNFPIIRNNHRRILKSILSLKESVVGTPSSIKVIEKDWDFLIVLDACRYDLFEDNNFIEGELKKINSAGSSTVEWIKNNFKGDQSDVVVVSSNPHLSDLRLKDILGKNPFCHIEDVWDYGWDDELKTVPPWAVNEGVKKVIKKHPDKKFIIHYMQPHFPFIGEHRIVHTGIETLRRRGKEKIINKGEERNPWDDLADGKIGLEDFMKAYSDNLILVLKHVRKLLPELDGNVVITSDHGNCIGEMGLHSHPGGFHIKPLIEVPWLVVDKRRIAKN